MSVASGTNSERQRVVHLESVPFAVAFTYPDFAGVYCFRVTSWTPWEYDPQHTAIWPSRGQHHEAERADGSGLFTTRPFCVIRDSASLLPLAVAHMRTP